MELLEKVSRSWGRESGKDASVFASDTLPRNAYAGSQVPDLKPFGGASTEQIGSVRCPEI